MSKLIKGAICGFQEEKDLLFFFPPKLNKLSLFPWLNKLNKLTGLKGQHNFRLFYFVFMWRTLPSFQLQTGLLGPYFPAWLFSYGKKNFSKKISSPKLHSGSFKVHLRVTMSNCTRLNAKHICSWALKMELGKGNTGIDKSIWKSRFCAEHTDIVYFVFWFFILMWKPLGFFLSVHCQWHFFITISLCLNANVFFFSVVSFNVSILVEIFHE